MSKPKDKRDPNILKTFSFDAHKQKVKILQVKKKTKANKFSRKGWIRFRDGTTTALHDVKGEIPTAAATGSRVARTTKRRRDLRTDLRDAGGAVAAALKAGNGHGSRIPPTEVDEVPYLNHAISMGQPTQMLTLVAWKMKLLNRRKGRRRLLWLTKIRFLKPAIINL